MLQKILLKLVDMLGRLYGQFNVAYNETYSDKKIGKKAKKEIDRRKEENKQAFINKVINNVLLDAYKTRKIILNPNIVRKYAESLFYQEKEKGNIDSLNIHKDFKNE